MQSDLAGKTMVVTGATSGIGLAAASELAGRGARVIGLGRSERKAEEARGAILARHPGARLTFFLGDLSSQREVRALGEQVRQFADDETGGKIDVLLNNAGMVANWYTASEDGYELQFAVNHLAPFLLTHLLLAQLQAAPAARVVTVSSRSHRRGRMHWEDVMLRKRYNTLRAYDQSKLANVLFTLEFNRRMGPGARVRTYAADPGLVNTEIGLKGTSGIVRWVWDFRRKKGADPSEGAATAVFLAADPAVEGAVEPYWKDCKPVAPGARALDAGDAKRLWELSERLCGIGDWGLVIGHIRFEPRLPIPDYRSPINNPQAPIPTLTNTLPKLSHFCL